MSRDITSATRAWLIGELDEWLSRGILNETQAKALLALYPSTEELGEQRLSRALLTLMALAALLVGLGVFLLIGYNWDDLPDAVKVVLIFSAILACHATGLVLRYRSGMRRASEVAFFFGSLMYGGGIWLIAQIYNINANDASGFWWWAVGVLPLALVSETLPLHVLFVGLLATWGGLEVFRFVDIGVWLFGFIPWLPNGVYSLPILALPGLWWCYRRNSARGAALYVLLYAWWIFLQPFAWRFHDNPLYFVGALGAWMLLLSAVHPEGSELAIPYRFYGAGLVGGALIPLSFHSLSWNSSWEGIVETCIVGGLAIVTLTLSVLWNARKHGDTEILTAELALAKRQWLPFSLILAMMAMALWSSITSDFVVVAVAANAAMVGLAFWLMQTGLREDRGLPFAGGVLYFLLWSILRYIDLFGAFGGMIGAALMFFLCGLSLFGVAIYWRRRKEVNLA